MLQHVFSRSRRFFHRLGLTWICGFSVILYLLIILWLDIRLPAQDSILHLPIFNDMILELMLFSSYIFISSHLYRKTGYWRQYPWILGSGLLFYFMCSTFCFVKSLIPYLMPYYLDPFLQRADLWLHFGHSPNQLLMPLLPPRLFYALDQFYDNGWFLGMYVYMFWQLFSRNNPGRIHFLSTFMMVFLFLGNGLALLLSSAGPIFYGLFYHDQYTAMNDAIVQHLYAINTATPLNVITTRELLLDWYRDPQTHVHLNIMSSMPSLHTAIAFLLMLHSLHYAKKLVWVTVPFFVVIALGSVALGWHYAVDTYVGAPLVYLLWRLNKPVFKPQENATV